MNRARSKRTVQPVMESKNYSFKKDILRDVMSAYETGLVPDVKIPNGGKSSVPSTVTRDELIAQHKSRMSNKNSE